VPVIRVDMPGKDLLPTAIAWTTEQGVAPKSLAEAAHAARLALRLGR
jgi:hypothetical protein